MFRTLAAVTLLLAASATPAAVPDRAEDVSPVAKGTQAPAFTVRNPDGTSHAFDPTALTKPMVLIFYRGGWCPYCNTQLASMREAEKELLQMGYDIYFLSSDRPEILYSSLKEKDVGYTMLSDAGMNGARALGVAFRVDDDTYAKYKTYGIDLESTTGDTHHQLPVPAVFIIDKNGIVQFVFFDPNYKVRLAPEPLLVAAREALKASS